MLLYTYKCLECNRRITEKDDSRKKCRCCGGKVTLKRITCRNSEPIKESGHKTVYSRALAIDPSQVAEAVAMHPDEEYVINEKEGIAMMVIKGARHQQKMAERHGMVDYSGMKVSK